MIRFDVYNVRVLIFVKKKFFIKYKYIIIIVGIYYVDYIFGIECELNLIKILKKRKNLKKYSC